MKSITSSSDLGARFVCMHVLAAVFVCVPMAVCACRGAVADEVCAANINKREIIA